MSDCIHGLELATCATCAGDPGVVSYRGTTKARHEGTCPLCEDVIEVGAPIVFDNDRLAWVHVACAE